MDDTSQPNIFRLGRAAFLKLDFWYKGQPVHEPGTCSCMVLVMTTGTRPDIPFQLWELEDYDILTQAIVECFPEWSDHQFVDVHLAYAFNDSPRTTKHDVLKVYDRAADIKDARLRERYIRR